MSLRNPDNPNAPATPSEQTPWFELAATRTRLHYTGESEQAAATERRVLEAVTRRRRKPKAIWLIPITLIGSGSLAWAEEVERAMQWTVERVQELVGTQPVVEPNETRVGVSSRRSRANGPVSSEGKPPAGLLETANTGVNAAEEAVAGELAVEVAPPPNPTSPRPRSGELRQVKGQPPAQASQAPTPPSDLERYRAGYVAQFERGDFAAALTAWDEYLRYVPGGRFTPDVRYNRAVALSQLGRKREAIAALTPFATGAYGPSRQQSAAKLIAKLAADE